MQASPRVITPTFQSLMVMTCCLRPHWPHMATFTFKWNVTFSYATSPNDRFIPQEFTDHGIKILNMYHAECVNRVWSQPRCLKFTRLDTNPFTSSPFSNFLHSLLSPCNRSLWLDSLFKSNAISSRSVLWLFLHPDNTFFLFFLFFTRQGFKPPLIRVVTAHGCQ